MLKFSLSLQAWNTDAFVDILKQEISCLDADTLPLQQGLSHSNYANSENLSAIILNIQNDENTISAKAGLFYTGIIAGCNCADDPTPVDEINEYCEVMLRIDRQTAETEVTLLNE